jgi:DNA replication and repair protein RecF
LILRSTTLKNFRTYRSETFTFHERFNLISGENGQGKTNLLEAIYLLCKFRPFKQVKLQELITFGGEEGRLKGEIESGTGFNEIHILLSRNTKSVKLNGKVVYDTGRLMGKFSVVTFLPSDMELVKGAPQSRRNYLDALICNFNPEHLADLKSYLRTLKQRNAFLGRMGRRDSETLEVWDEKIAELGGKIAKRRIKLTERLEPALGKNYRAISGLSPKVEFRYNLSFKAGDNLEEELGKELRTRVEKDKLRGQTSVGPHRDVPTFTINGNDASSFASQGEAKTLALALKASEIEITRNVLKRTPILLLDDITSELDENRKRFLFGMVEEFPGQIFITTTNPKEVVYGGDKKNFYIKAGKAQVMTG